MSGAGLIELLAARLARRAPREAAPELRQVLQSRMLRPEDIGDATRRDLSTWGPRGVAGDEILDRPIQVTPTSVDDLLANNPQFLEDPERAAEFAARSTPLPPVMMRGGKLIDGRHRLEAARIRGNDTIDAVDLDQFERSSAPSLRSALSEVNANRTGLDAGPVQGGRASVADLRARFDPFGADNPWEVAPITKREVRQAMQNGTREMRRFDDDGLPWTRQDHINRIATLARDGWDEPIDLTARQGVYDGVHRLAAAIVRGDDTIATRQAPTGVFGHGDIHTPSGLKVERDGTHWQVVDASNGAVVRRLPPGSTFADANTALRNARTAPDGGSARIENDLEGPYFHGTARTGFDVPSPRRESGGTPAIYLAENETFARQFADVDGPGGRVLPFNVRTADVARMDNPEHFSRVAEALARRMGWDDATARQQLSRRVQDGRLDWAYRDGNAAVQEAGFKGVAINDAYGERSVAVYSSDALIPNRTAPNAGSDRNALQRALRERMERE